MEEKKIKLNKNKQQLRNEKGLYLCQWKTNKQKRS